MKYLKKFKDSSRWIEVSYNEALNSVLGTYNDNDEVRSWLDHENEICCLFADIKVISDSTR